jgi:hypothetical protein
VQVSRIVQLQLATNNEFTSFIAPNRRAAEGYAVIMPERVSAQQVEGACRVAPAEKSDEVVDPSGRQLKDLNLPRYWLRFVKSNRPHYPWTTLLRPEPSGQKHQ